MSLILLAAVASARASTPKPGDTHTSDAPQSLLVRLARAYEDLKAGRCEAADAAFKTIEADAEFTGMDTKLRFATYLGESICSSDPKAAYVAVRTATGYPEATDEIWKLRFERAVIARDADAVLDTAEAAGARWPRILSSLSDAELQETFYPTLYAKPEAVRRFMATLDAADYKAHDPLPQLSLDDYWLDYAAGLAGKDDVAGAMRALNRVQHGEMKLAVYVDKRFARLLQAKPADFDPRAMVERQLSAARALAAANPRRLRGVVWISDALRDLGRFDEAEALLARTQAAIELGEEKGSPPFDDLDQLNWFHNAHAYSLESVGRVDAALASMAAGARNRENGHLNVSQAINLAVLYDNEGRPNDALAALKDFEGSERRTSALGDMVLWSARACAYAQTGDAKALKAELGRMAAHVEDNRRVYAHALLCANDLDALAALQIREFEDTDTRVHALLGAATFNDPPHRGTWDQELRRRQALLLARPDVSRALAAVGSTRKFDLW